MENMKGRLRATEGNMQDLTMHKYVFGIPQGKNGAGWGTILQEFATENFLELMWIFCLKFQYPDRFFKREKPLQNQKKRKTI